MRATLRLAATILICASAGVAADEPRDGQPFRARAVGRIDLTALSAEFEGWATQLGRFSASGRIDPATLDIQGTMTSAAGDTLAWTALLQQGPGGEVDATFVFAGGSGRFSTASGGASGAVALDAGLGFEMILEGAIVR